MSFIIVPIQTTDTTLDSTNVADSTYPVWVSTTVFDTLDIVKSPSSDGVPHEYQWWPPEENPGSSNWFTVPATHSVLRRELMDHTVWSNSPLYYAYWLDLGATNRFKMFDGRSRAATTNSDDIIVEITPGVLFNAVALLNVVADTVEIVVTDPIDGVVYSVTEAMLDLTGINDFYQWFFYAPVNRGNIVKRGIPAYPDATIKVTATNTGGVTEVGELVVGVAKDVGTLLYGTSFGREDYSKKDRDDNGIATIVPGETHKTCDYSLTIANNRYSAVSRIFDEIISTPAVFVGDEDIQDTIIFGLLSDFSIVLKNHLRTSCSITVEEIS